MTQTSLPPHDLHTEPEPAGRGGSPSDFSLGDFSLIARSLAEAAGSFLLVLAGLGVTILNTQTGVQPTLAFGLALIGAIVAFGYVSGGHFNPAVTLGSAVAGRTPWSSVLHYVVAQVVGGLAAVSLIWLLLSANQQFAGSVQALFAVSANGFGENSPTQFALSSAFLAEVVATAIFVAVVLGAMSRTPSGAVRHAGGPFAIGLVYAALLTFLLPITNGSMNPARSTAAALFSEGWALEQLWLFWAAPLLGAAIAGLIYRSAELFGGRSKASASSMPAAGTSSDIDSNPADSNPADSNPADSNQADAKPVDSSPRASTADDAQTFFDSDSDRHGDRDRAGDSDRDSDRRDQK